MTITWDVTSLSNGLRVVTTPVASAQSVSINVFVGVGSRRENRRNNGASHFLEHMLFKGTERWPDAITIAELIEGSGGSLNAYTTKELTCYWNHLPHDCFTIGIEVLADTLRRSLLSVEEIERERSVIQQEIKRSQDQPGAWAAELLARATFGDQPLGWSIAGTTESVSEIQRPDLVEHIQNWYVPENMVVSVAGNIDHDTVMEAVTRLFGDMERTDLPELSGADAAMPEERVLLDHRDTAQCNLALGMRSLSRNDPDRYAAMIMNTLLGRGMSSRLFREVRERRGLAYSVGSSFARYRDAGMFAVSAGVSPENVEEAVKVILIELKKLNDELVSDEELRKAIDYSVGSFRLGLESTMALGQRSGDALLTMGEIEPIDEVVEQFRSITAEDIQRVARRIFGQREKALSVVGPFRREEALRGILEDSEAGG